MEDLTGKQLGQYQLQEPLGQGGMATVYKAFQPSIERSVALKILPKHFAADPNFVKRFQREAKVIANLQHPHIMQVFDFGEADGYTYIVMPFVKGGTLSELMKEKSLTVQEIQKITQQVGGALAYAHDQGLIHRDLKPSNIMLDQYGNCLLMDFGIAKIVESSETQLTATGGLIGTPAYMSPEQGLGKKLDSRSDVYSFGLVLYQMLTGRLPYEAETPMALVMKHINDPLPMPRKVNPNIPESLERVLLKALAKEPSDRYDSITKMVEAVEKTLSETPTVTSEPIPEPETVDMERTAPSSEADAPQKTAAMPKKKRNLKPLWIIGGILAVVTVCVVVGLSGRALLASIVDQAPTAEAQLPPVDEAESGPASEAGGEGDSEIEVDAVPDTPLEEPNLYLVFDDDFSSTTGQGWRITDFDIGYSEIIGGNLRLVVEASAAGGGIWVSNRGYTLDDFDLEATGVIEEGYDSTIDILFGVQKGVDFFKLSWNESQEFQILRYLNAEWETLVDWTSNDALHAGLGAENTANLVMTGNNLFVEFNGQLVGEFVIRDYEGGEIGLGCLSGGDEVIVCLFDRMIAHSPDPVSVYISPNWQDYRVVYPGQQVYIQFGWITSKIGYAQDFINAGIVRVYQDGELLQLSTRQENNLWTSPVPWIYRGEPAYLAQALFPVELPSGQSTFSCEVETTYSIQDGYDNDGDGELDVFDPWVFNFGEVTIEVVEP